MTFGPEVEVKSQSRRRESWFVLLKVKIGIDSITVKFEMIVEFFEHIWKLYETMCYHSTISLQQYFN